MIRRIHDHITNIRFRYFNAPHLIRVQASIWSQWETASRIPYHYILSPILECFWFVLLCFKYSIQKHKNPQEWATSTQGTFPNVFLTKRALALFEEEYRRLKWEVATNPNPNLLDVLTQD